MLAVISPAKKLDFEPLSDDVGSSLPAFQDEANKLAKAAKRLSVSALRDMMKISEDLAKLNRERFQAFAETSDEMNSKQAAFAFAGDTYQGLQAAELSAADLDYAQDHLRILSGMYGVLRPLDRIQPYRLEMGRKIKVGRANSLYEFWGEQIGGALDEAAGGEAVINLASNEYFKAAGKKMASPVITPAFKEDKGGELKMIGFFAKKARGMMARFMIENRIEKLEDLKGFNSEGYRFQADLSDERAWVFTRKTPPA